MSPPQEPLSAPSAAAVAAAPASSAAAPFDASPFLSIEARSRVPSGLKSFYPITIRPGMRSLGGGLPHPDTFVLQHFSAGVVQRGEKDEAAAISAPDVLVRRVGDGSSIVATGAGLSVEEFLQYSPGLGWDTVRAAIRDVLLVDGATPRYADWEFLVTHGSTAAWDLCARMFLDRGDGLLVEEFTYSSTLEQSVPHGIVPVPVRIDDEGMVPADIPRAVAAFQAKHPGARCNVLYVVPTGQNPTGTRMSVQRRKDLLAVCRELNLLVIEDDPYSFLELPDYLPADRRGEYKYPGITDLTPTMLSMDTEGRVVHLFTFSKIMAPGFRVGYLVAHNSLMKYLRFVSEGVIQSAAGFSQG
ncbi:Aromatic/aminoadipate aminotransferase 1, partial [Cladochytrium tenue]